MPMQAAPIPITKTIPSNIRLALEPFNCLASMVPQMIPEMPPPNKAINGATSTPTPPTKTEAMVNTGGASKMPKNSGQLVLGGVGVAGAASAASGLPGTPKNSLPRTGL